MLSNCCQIWQPSVRLLNTKTNAMLRSSSGYRYWRTTTVLSEPVWFLYFNGCGWVNDAHLTTQWCPSGRAPSPLIGCSPAQEPVSPWQRCPDCHRPQSGPRSLQTGRYGDTAPGELLSSPHWWTDPPDENLKSQRQKVAQTEVLEDQMIKDFRDKYDDIYILLLSSNLIKRSKLTMNVS